MKKIIIIISAILCVVFGLYLTDYGYVRLKSAVEKVPRGEELFEMIEVVLNEFDFVKVINQVELSDDDYVDLILSGDDLSDLQNRLTKYIDEGFIRDEINEWRKAKIIVDGRPEKIKYKVHGTSVSPLHHGISLWARLRAKLGLGERSVAIGYGSFSLKIKHKKTSKYRGLMRRYNLITVNDDVELSTIAINKIAADIGLIAPYGKMVIVRINKSPIGMYMMVENHGKEWFERNHRLTNYTIMKSNDDWDRKLPGHVSDTDLYIQNKEVDGASVNDGIALSALDILFTAINSNDLKTVKRLIDVDYMAKYMAMLTITNNSHPITGDNLRYVYDHSIGRFKLLFRVEDTALKNINDISGFNASLFNTYPGDNIYTHKLFKLLVADPDFRYKRDRVLFGIIQNRDKMLEITANVFKENEKILFSNKKPTRSSFIKMKKFIRVLTENINKAERYLKYNKVYVTKYGSELKILNDSYNPTILVKIKYKGQKGRDRVVEKNQVVISPRLDMKQQIIHDIHRVNVQSGVINDVVFKNSITNKVIDSKHVYMNNASLFTVSSNKKLLNNLEESKINYAIDHANKSIVIKPGEYHLYTDIVMPYRYSVTLLAGVVFRLDEGVSFLIQGDFIAIGSEHKPIKIVGNSNSKHFGVFAIIGESDNFANVNIENLYVNGGGEDLINGILFSGQMSIHNADVSIDGSSFSNSSSDDGINIKYSKVKISNSNFFDNDGDQLDLDFCSGNISGNIFSFYDGYSNVNIMTDGLDVSGSVLTIKDNKFNGFSDKGISVGEKSTVLVMSNELINNNSGVSVKDGSISYIANNEFNYNNVDIAAYIKKKFYSLPKVYADNSVKKLNKKVVGGVNYLDNSKVESAFKYERGGLK